MANRLNFADYNFDSLVSQLRVLVKQQDAWKDISVEAGTGNVLIELFAYVTEMLMYYLERRAQESYIDTAQLKSSIIRLVGLLGYKPKRATSAIGDLTFTLPGGWYAEDIYLPRGTVLRTADGTKFLVSLGAVLRRGETSVVVSGMQGELKQVSAVADGTTSFTVTINDTTVENTNLRVMVNNEEWDMVDSFVDYSSDSKVFVQETLFDERVKITFGDGKFGKSPSVGDTITIEYISTSGSLGNVYSTGQITTIVSSIYDATLPIPLNVTPLLTVSNTSMFLGGDDAEDKEEIRDEAPRVFKTGDRAVTREDYIAILENIPGVKTAYVWGERDENPPNITYFNKVRIVCLLQNWTNPDNTFKLYLKSILEEKEQLTVWLEFVNADIVETIADVELKVLEAYQTSTIITNVATMLDSLFALGTVKLGVSIRYSDVVAAIESVVGVDYTHLTFRHREYMGTGDGGTTYFSVTSKFTPLKINTVKIYKNSTLVGSDNGAGGITGATCSGSVDYTTGLTQVTFNGMNIPAAGDIIYTYYEQDAKGDIVVGTKEIARLIAKNFTVL